MALVTGDFETYYDQQYSLRRMSTAEYILDPRFEAIMLSLKVNDGPSRVLIGYDAIARGLSELDWDKVVWVSHHTNFDGAILAWKFGRVPAMYACTLSMARATTHWVIGRSSLEKVSEYLGLPPKGKEVVMAMGKRLANFSPPELAAYATYCMRDDDNCYDIFQRLRPLFADSELKLIDLVVRMFVQPQVQLDPHVLAEHLNQVRADKAQIMAKVAHIDPSTFSSQLKFKALLESYGVDVPTKVSPTTGEEIPALAKNDRAFKELCMDEGQPLEVQALLAARINSKSTLEETRTQKLLDNSLRHWGPSPQPTMAGVDKPTWDAMRSHGLAMPDRGSGWAAVPLKYYGARPGRLSGDGGENWQNFKRGSRIREGIRAPAGYRIVHRDASQIEARLVAWLARCTKLTEAFAQKRDVYSEFASSVYSRPVTKADSEGRFVGKTCLAAGTRVLTNRGAVPIEAVTTSDLVWDGVEWARHEGLLAQGLRETLTLSGVCLTPDHRVWCGSQWKAASEVDVAGHFPPSVIGAASLQSQVTSFRQREEGFNPSLYSAIVEYLNTQLTVATSRISEVRDVMPAQNKRRLRNVIGFMPTLCLTTNTELGCLTGWPRRSRDVIAKLQSTINTMGYAVSSWLKCGATIVLSFFDTYKLCPAGITPPLKWTGSKRMGITRRAISGSPLAPLISPTSGGLRISRRASENLKPVFDLANAGPRRRFTILSDDGPVIVSNCILGLGYGCGHEKFRHMLFIGNGGQSKSVDEFEAKRIVYHYRNEYPEIPELWNACGWLLMEIVGSSRQAMRSLLKGQAFIERLPVKAGYDSLWLPNGMCIAYPNLRYERTVNGNEMFYDDPYGGKRKIYGAKCTQNIGEGLGRIIVTDIAVRLFDLTGRHPFLSTHDSLDYCVPLEEVEWWDQELERQFAVVPSWAEGLPLASEGGWGVTLLDAERMVNA